MSKSKLRELSPVIISVIILTIAIIGLARAAGTNNGSIGGLFWSYTNAPGYDYNLGNSTSSGYRLDARNIYPTNFGSTKTIEAGSGVFSNKVTSADTISTDSSGTLTTKGYVEDFANNAATTAATTVATTAANNAKDNLGNHIATQDLNMKGNNIIKVGAMYDNNNRIIRYGSGGKVITYGITGWYNGTFGGGWYMADNTWIRSYANKSIYTGGDLSLGGKAYSALTLNGDTSNTLITKSYIDSKIGSTSSFSCPTGKYLAGFNIKTGLSICNTLPAGGGGTLDLLNGLHSSTQCTTLGGTVTTIPGGNKLCKFNLSTCNVGFYKYLNWSTTRPGGVSPYSHVFSNTPVESTRLGGWRWGRAGRHYSYTTYYSIVTQIGCF